MFRRGTKLIKENAVRQMSPTCKSKTTSSPVVQSFVIFFFFFETVLFSFVILVEVSSSFHAIMVTRRLKLKKNRVRRILCFNMYRGLKLCGSIRYFQRGRAFISDNQRHKANG